MPNEIAAVRGTGGIPIEMIGSHSAPAHVGSYRFGGEPAPFSYNAPHRACIAVRRSDKTQCSEARISGGELCEAHHRAAQAASQK